LRPASPTASIGGHAPAGSLLCSSVQICHTTSF
jgi:hypothetical protein